MARPSRRQISSARKAQEKAQSPIRFVADHNDVTTLRTVAYKAGQVVERPSPSLRARAIRLGKAVEA